MQIDYVHIHNYRSIQDLEFKTQDLVVLLGPNNHGKSNIVRAIEFALSTSAKPTEDDVCAFCDEEEPEVWVELTFTDLTDQEQRTFEKYVLNGGSVRIRKTARMGANGPVRISYCGYVDQPEQWWLQASAPNRLGTQAQVEAEAEAVPELLSLLEGGGRITKQRISDFQQAYIEQNRQQLVFREEIEDGPLLGAKNVAGGVLPAFYLVPAVRDLSDETKVKGTTMFGRLLQRAITDMAESDPRFVHLQDSMGEIIKELNARPQDTDELSEMAKLEAAIAAELEDWHVGVSIQILPPQIERLFELGTELRLDDGINTLAEQKGHGLQRAVVFGLVRAWAKMLRSRVGDETVVARRASESVVLAIEEPELFLHPHAQRQLAQWLEDIAHSPGYQVLICSHSTHFVNLDQYQSIAIVSKNDVREGTTVRQCNCDLFEGNTARDKKHRFHMASWINPDRGELFFARKVIFVEGETEKTVLPYLATKIGCYSPNVSIIDCGSKHNLPLYITLANAFNLSYAVVHDEDPLPDPIPCDWGEDKRREKQRTYDLNARIAGLVEQPRNQVVVCSPDFEGTAGVPRTQGAKKGKALAALDHFADRAVQDIPTGLVTLVGDAYRC